jgi:hypothetical protein
MGWMFLGRCEVLEQAAYNIEMWWSESLTVRLCDHSGFQKPHSFRTPRAFYTPVVSRNHIVSGHRVVSAHQWFPETT